MSQNNEKLLSLHSFFTAEQSKYVYFLLAAAVSSIAFWISRTSGLQIKLTDLGAEHILLFGSVLLWLLSVAFGLMNRSYILSTAYSNMDALLMQNSEHPKSFSNPAYNEAAYEGIMTAVASKGKKAELYFKIQFLLFCTGAAIFSSWHILQIITF